MSCSLRYDQKYISTKTEEGHKPLVFPVSAAYTCIMHILSRTYSSSIKKVIIYSTKETKKICSLGLYIARNMYNGHTHPQLQSPRLRNRQLYQYIFRAGQKAIVTIDKLQRHFQNQHAQYDYHSRKKAIRAFDFNTDSDSLCLSVVNPSKYSY